MSLMSKSSRLKYFLGSILFLFLTASFVKSSFEVFKSKDRLDEINQEILEMEKKKKDIEKEIEYKKTDEYIEEKARNDLNLIKPDEEIYVVVKSKNDDNTLNNVLSESDKREIENKEVKNNQNKNWYSWYRLFFND